jgi:hypothetical protein
LQGLTREEVSTILRLVFPPLHRVLDLVSQNEVTRSYQVALTMMSAFISDSMLTKTGAAMAYGVQNDRRIALGTSVLLLVVMARRFVVRLTFPKSVRPQGELMIL